MKELRETYLKERKIALENLKELDESLDGLTESNSLVLCPDPDDDTIEEYLENIKIEPKEDKKTKEKS